jgi:hypothetical protein
MMLYNPAIRAMHTRTTSSAGIGKSASSVFRDLGEIPSLLFWTGLHVAITGFCLWAGLRLIKAGLEFAVGPLRDE